MLKESSRKTNALTSTHHAGADQDHGAEDIPGDVGLGQEGIAKKIAAITKPAR